CWRVYSYFQEIDGKKSSEKPINQYLILTGDKLIDCNLERGRTQVLSYNLLHRKDEVSSMHASLSIPFTFGQPIGDQMTATMGEKTHNICRFRFDGQSDSGPLIVVYFAERLSDTNDLNFRLYRELQRVLDNPHDFKRLEEFSPTNSDSLANGYWNVETIRIQNGSRSTELTGFNLEKRLVFLSDSYFCSPVFQNRRWVGGYEHTIQAQNLTDDVRRCILNTPFSWGASLNRRMTVRYDRQSDRTEIVFNSDDKSFSVTMLLKRLTDEQRDIVVSEMHWHQDLFVAANKAATIESNQVYPQVADGAFNYIDIIHGDWVMAAARRCNYTPSNFDSSALISTSS
ncbi:MAG: hypothetical protein R3C53_13230, partial [Pirellulaceae bacterium]